MRVWKRSKRGQITVQRTFADFDDYWTTVLGGASVGPTLAAMASADLEGLKARMRARLPVEPGGGITCGARANAVKGRVPGSRPRPAAAELE